MLTLWSEIQEMIGEINVQLMKNLKGNSSAGVRARKGLRTLKAKCGALTKLTVENDKLRKREKTDDEKTDDGE
jgi:hypothetical protein